MQLRPLVLLLLLSALPVTAQESLLQQDQLPGLNRIIDSLEQVHRNSPEQGFSSFPQATAHYFALKTNAPEAFIAALDSGTDIEALALEFDQLQLDKDLLVIKSVGTNYKKEKELVIKSFEIGSRSSHSLRLVYQDSLDGSQIQYFYKTFQFRKGLPTIYGFYLRSPFRTQPLPGKYSQWIGYADALVQPGTALFREPSGNSEIRFGMDPVIDTLVNYYALKTGKPEFKKEEDSFAGYRERLKAWESKRGEFTDSLFRKDKEFRELLKAATTYAVEEKASNAELEFFIARTTSKELALELKRNNRQVGSCSMDDSPLQQQREIAALAAAIPNWPVFIKAFMNVLNDNVERVANSNIAANARRTYVEELEKLDLDLQQLLLGTNFRFEDTEQPHYFSGGDKVAKAFAALPAGQQLQFEKVLKEIIRDESLDDFNRLHFYNTFGNYGYFLADSLRKEQVEAELEQLRAVLPYPIRSRLENPHKELEDLLFREKQALSRFEILDSSIGHITSFGYSGDCWIAEVREKGVDPQLSFDLTMPMETTITPFSNFLEKKDELRKRVEGHAFLLKILSENQGSTLTLNFVEDRSFSQYRDWERNMPLELLEELNFEDAVSFFIRFGRFRAVSFVLLRDGSLVLLDIPKDFTLPGYSFRELVTEEREGFLEVIYKSARVFNERGEMLR